MIWKRYLYEKNLSSFKHYRRNYNNQDSMFKKISEIPKYGLLSKSGQIELFDEMSDSILKTYYTQF